MRKESNNKSNLKHKAIASSARLVLESRLLFDGAVVATAEVVDDKIAAQTKSVDADKTVIIPLFADAGFSLDADNTPGFTEFKNIEPMPAAITAAASTGELNAPNLIIADSRTDGLARLLANPPKDTRIEILSSNQDGYQQIASILDARSHNQQVNILTASAGGKSWLGSTRLDTLISTSSSNTIADWGDRLPNNNNLVFFGKDSVSQTWLNQIQDLTGGNVSWNAYKDVGSTPAGIAGGRVTQDAYMDIGGRELSGTITEQLPRATQGAVAEQGDTSSLIMPATNPDDLSPIGHVAAGQSSTIVFIDKNVDNINQLIAAIDPNDEVVILNDTVGGLDQIASYLAGRTEISSIQILSHGTEAELHLGADILTNSNLARQAGILAAIGRSLSNSGDILLYGCKVAEGADGDVFVKSFAELTGADVAASTDITGFADLGGNWTLETTVGLVESSAIAAPQWQSTLAAGDLVINVAAPSVDATATTGYQSAPKIVRLKDGRTLHVWSNDAIYDELTSMTVHGRIFNANGTAATAQFQIGTKAVDGADGFDWDNLDVKVLTSGNVAIGWVRNTAEAGDDEPIFSIIDPTYAPTDPLFKVISDVIVQQNNTTTYESPPILTPLSDGRFMATWTKKRLK